MAEHVINTVYALGTHPDQWCKDVLVALTKRVFDAQVNPGAEGEDQSMGDADANEGEEGAAEKNGEAEKDGDVDGDGDGDVSMEQPISALSQRTQSPKGGKDMSDAFVMSQMIFVVGHVALKQLVFMEVVEREWKRQKDEKLAGKSSAALRRMLLSDLTGEQKIKRRTESSLQRIRMERILIRL